MQIINTLSLNLILSLILAFSQSIHAQTLKNGWETKLSNSLNQFLECSNGNAISDNCRTYSGESLNTVYGLDDFYSTSLGRYLYVNEISDMLSSSSKWTLLGKGFDQKALIEAQDFANSKKAVVAIYKNAQGEGLHVALILPGTIINSGTWGYKVPNAASFFTGEPSKSFMNKGLSYAFNKSQIGFVNLYARNY